MAHVNMITMFMPIITLFHISLLKSVLTIVTKPAKIGHLFAQNLTSFSKFLQPYLFHCCMAIKLQFIHNLSGFVVATSYRMKIFYSDYKIIN